MAKVRVSAVLLEECLFEGSEFPVTITNVWFSRHPIPHVLLEIEGPSVPDVVEVQCEITQNYRTCKFTPVKPTSGDNNG